MQYVWFAYVHGCIYPSIHYKYVRWAYGCGEWDTARGVVSGGKSVFGKGLGGHETSVADASANSRAIFVLRSNREPSTTGRERERARERRSTA